jgi:hypothetical protein
MTSSRFCISRLSCRIVSVVAERSGLLEYDAGRGHSLILRPGTGTAFELHRAAACCPDVAHLGALRLIRSDAILNVLRLSASTDCFISRTKSNEHRLRSCYGMQAVSYRFPVTVAISPKEAGKMIQNVSHVPVGIVSSAVCRCGLP